MSMLILYSSKRKEDLLLFPGRKDNRDPSSPKTTKIWAELLKKKIQILAQENLLKI
jgi:hypothetical protein